MLLLPISKSTYSVFQKCPWKAHAHKNLHLRSVAGEAADIGRAVHEILERILKGQIEYADIDLYSENAEIAELAKNVALFPFPTDENGNVPVYFVEQDTFIDSEGRITDLQANSIAHGLQDVCWRESVDTARFRDWKTGMWEKRDEFESHLYALLCRAMFPGATKIIAELCFLRSGHILRTEYKWQDDNTVCVVTTDDKQEQLWSETDPILEYLAVRVDEILMTPPDPRPGPHCTKWYGQPCQFFGNLCPLTPKNYDAELPSVVTKDYAKSLASVIRGEALDKKLASDGLYAIQQMSQFIKEAEGRIQDWSKQNGSIEIGGHRYGWKNTTTNEVDTEFVLETLINANIPLSDLARVVNISKTSIGKLPKKKYGDLRETIETFGVSTVAGKPRFGELKGQVDA